jgi:opacity protein-like surface antigen
MSNLYYDWYHNFEVMDDRPISPYMGIGVGVANVNMPEGSINSVKVWNSGSDTAFAYQISIGSGFKITKNIMLDVLYRYFGSTDIKVGQIKAGFSNHNILLGIRYTYR